MSASDRPIPGCSTAARRSPRIGRRAFWRASGTSLGSPSCGRSTAPRFNAGTRVSPTEKGLSAGTAVRHFNVMHHMMEKAATIWSKETGIDRNPADPVEVKRPDDQRDRYLMRRRSQAEGGARSRRCTARPAKGINQTFFRLRLDRSDRAHHRDADRRDLRLEVARLAVQRGADRGAGEAEGRQDPVCSDAARTSRGVQQVTRRFSGRTGSFLRSREPSANARGWSGASRPSLSWPGSRISVSRSPAHVRVLVHDERRGSVRTRQDPRSLEHQDDRTLRQTGQEPHRQDGQHGARDVEADGRQILAEASSGAV